MNARRTTAKIFINGKNATEDLSNHIEKITYVDNLSGEVDTVELELADVEKIFIGDWAIERGDTLEVTLIKINWSDQSEETLDLGSFETDEIVWSMPPSVMRVKANSVPQNSFLRQVNESQSFEHTKLSEIAQDIADAAQMELFFQADDVDIERAERGEESALNFLAKLCKDNYLCLKVADGQIIIFDEKILDQNEPALTIRAGDAILERIQIKATLTEIYKSCEVNYQHGKHAEKYSAKIEDPTKTTGKTLKINRKVNSQSEAEKLAENELRERNKKENTLTLTCAGDFRLVAGNVIALESFGVFDGNWLIEKATHEIGSGYDVRAECRKCLLNDVSS